MHHLTPRDVVPALRSDLTVNRPPTGAGAEVIKVTPLDSPTPHAMRGFEFSIARMLDGKRTVGEVMTNCERIGLPLDLRSLEGLVHQLEAHGLIADEQHPGVGDGAPFRRSRRPWTLEVRELYRSALRSAREGDLASAHKAVDRLLEAAPGTIEALTLRDWVDEQQHAKNTGLPFRTILSAAEEAWRSEPIPKDAPPTPPPLTLGTPRPAMAPFLVLAAGLAVLTLAVVVPLPRIAIASARFDPLAVSQVLSPREGTVDQVLVQEGDHVVKGQPLVTWNVADIQVRLAEVREELEEARRPLREATAQTPQGRQLLANLRRAETDVTRAQGALLEAQKQGEGLPYDDEMRRYERDFAQAIAIRDAARKQLDALAPDEGPQALKVYGLAMEAAMLEALLKDPHVRAEHEGDVRDLNVQPGQYVDTRQRLLQLDDRSQMKVVATVTPRVARLANPGEPITIDTDGHVSRGTIEEVKDFHIVTRVANPDGALQPGSLSVNLEFRARALWETWR